MSDREWIIALIRRHQPIAWSLLLQESGCRSAGTVRDVVHDLIDEGLAEATSHGMIWVGHGSDHE